MLARCHGSKLIAFRAARRTIVLAIVMLLWGSSFAQAVTLRYGDIVAVYSTYDEFPGPRIETIVRIDPLTGEHERIATLEGLLPSFRGIGLTQGTDGALYLANPSLGGIQRIDPATGDVTIVSQAAFSGRPPQIGNGPGWIQPYRIVSEESGSLLVSSSASLLRVDPQTGDRTTLSGVSFTPIPSAIGDGPEIGSGRGLALESPTTALAFTNPQDSILRVDLTTGDRELLSGPTRGTGPLGSQGFIDLLFTHAGKIIAVADGDDLDFLVWIDPITGDRELIPGSDFGNWAPMIAEMPSGQLAMVGGLNYLAYFDPATGELTPLGQQEHLSMYLGLMVYVPEPSSWLLSLVGLGLVPFFARRKAPK